MSTLEDLAEKFVSIAAHGSMTDIPLACADLCRTMASLITKNPEPFDHIEGVRPDIRRPVICCYAPHLRAIEALLKCPFDMRLRTVHDESELRGIEGGTFAYVTNHPDQVPAYMWQTIRVYGWLVINIDDSYARARAAR